jgi:hypothetical protein
VWWLVGEWVGECLLGGVCLCVCSRMVTHFNQCWSPPFHMRLLLAGFALLLLHSTTGTRECGERTLSLAHLLQAPHCLRLFDVVCFCALSS